MSKQLALSIAVSVMAMVSFVLLGQQAGVQQRWVQAAMAGEYHAAMISVGGDFAMLPGAGYEFHVEANL